MKVVIIDGQGGRLGALICQEISKRSLSCETIAIGTNSIATSAMIKAGASKGATGENPVIVACRDADIICGPIGIISADSLLGEITPNMAVAIAQSNATKLLLPVNHCKNLVVGVKSQTMSEQISEAVNKIEEILAK